MTRPELYADPVKVRVASMIRNQVRQKAENGKYVTLSLPIPVMTW